MGLGPKLTDPEEQLFRQVHPSWIQEDRPSSQAFRPTPKDEGLLSVSRSNTTTAAAAYERHTSEKGLASAGVWAVTVEDCAAVGLSAYEHPVTEPIEDPAHSAVDFRACSDKETRKKAKLLKAVAEPVYVSREP